MQKGKIKFFQIPIIKIGLWWIYFRRRTNGCGLVPLNGKIAKTFILSSRAKHFVETNQSFLIRNLKQVTFSVKYNITCEFRKQVYFPFLIKNNNAPIQTKILTYNYMIAYLEMKIRFS